jgi:ATP-dependent helicase HrpB
MAGMLKRRLNLPPDRARQGSLGRLLAWAYPDRIAQRRPAGAGRFLLASGRGAWLNPDEPLAAREYIVAAELDGDRSDARIFLAAAYDGDALQRQHETRLIWKSEVVWNADQQRVEAFRRCYLGALVVKTERLHNPDPAQLRAALLTGIRAQGLECLPWTPSLRVWVARVTFLNRRLGGAWPDLSDARLLETLDDWLAPFVSGRKRLQDLTALDLERALSGFLDWRQARDLDHLAPRRLAVPSGRRIEVDYRTDPPVLAVKLQEMFGQLQTPRVAGGRQAVLVHLLSPAGRPVQITQDLAGFWKNGYNVVRKELRGRYPKHYWPEDPFSARATAGVRPRKT